MAPKYLVQPDDLKKVLIDARNIDQWEDALIKMMQIPKPTGIDLETHNEEAHAGILEYKSLVFDVNRTIITGLSLYKDEEKAAFYFNLNQADVENRIPWARMVKILEANDKGLWIAHNLNFELTMLLSVYGFTLPIERSICTMQQAVSAYNQDEYNPELMKTVGVQNMEPVIIQAAQEYAEFGGRQNMTARQSELLGQIVGKSSKAAFSYNGLVKSVSYGYGLKQAVKSFFGFQMETYEEVLKKANAKHMGQLTGEQVLSYGADDSYWAVRLFHRLYEKMLAENPKVIETFLTQENPMIQVYSDVWRHGIRINTENVKAQREVERGNYAKLLVDLKKEIKTLLPFDKDPHDGMMKDDAKGYAKSYQKYRDRIVAWANTSDVALTNYAICKQVSGSVSEAWCSEKGEGKGDLNFAYYMTQRVIMYDLFRQKAIKYKGKIQSDGDARGKIIERLAKDTAQYRVMNILNEMVGIEQRMKLYLNPYLLLIDPETNKIYPQLSSQLNTRRMATSFPNPMQLSKRGESTYIRGFYLPDEDDYVIVSLDWSSFELVIIGELSGDPEFASVFGQLPFGDLHTGAAVDCLRVTIPELTLDIFNNLSKMTVDEINAINPKILIDTSGKPMSPQKAKKDWRVKVGKGANFNYWYSGALSTVGDTLGWSPDTMWKATEAYRERFAVAEAWRIRMIQELQMNGYLTLPDGHRRVRWEATPEFNNFMTGQFKQREQLLNLGHTGISTFGNLITKSLQSRANNQGINALVQGTNAFVAKRSIMRINAGIVERMLRARFMMPIHDELVFSVHREDVVKFIELAKFVMRNHQDIFKTLKLDCTASVGRTFEPWDPKKAPLGQIELDELQADILDFKQGDRLDNDGIERIVNEYLFK